MTLATTKPVKTTARKLNYRPLGDRVIVQQDSPDSKTEGGILLPDQMQKKPNVGVVVAINTAPDMNPQNLTKGDRVLFGPYAGEPLPGHPDYLLLRSTDLIAVEE